MRKTTLFAALLSVFLIFGALVPNAEAQRWRGRTYGGYAPAYTYAPYSPSYYAPSYYAPSYYTPSYYSTSAYRYYPPDTTYIARAASVEYAAPAATYVAPSYYYSAPYYRGYWRGGYVRTPRVSVGW
jgi:hypothetical protein